MPTFRTTILQARKTATGIEVPPDIVDELGAGKKPPVVVTVDGYEYRSTVAIMGGQYLIPLSSEHRAASGLAAGDAVEVTLVLDDQPRQIAVPGDLASALDQDPAVRAAFDTLSFSRKRALVDPIEQAKTPETREHRIAKAVESLGG